jgi:hypothetical protein
MWPLRSKYKVHVGQSLRVKYLWLTQLCSESTRAGMFTFLVEISAARGQFSVAP